MMPGMSALIMRRGRQTTVDLPLAPIGLSLQPIAVAARTLGGIDRPTERHLNRIIGICVPGLGFRPPQPYHRGDESGERRYAERPRPELCSTRSPHGRGLQRLLIGVARYSTAYTLGGPLEIS